MSDKLIAIARDNTIRVSSLKLANVARSIVNLKASKAINQLKFSQKRRKNRTTEIAPGPGVAPHAQLRPFGSGYVG